MGSDRIEELLLQLIQDMAEVKAKLNNIDEQKLSSRIDMLEAQTRESERMIKLLEKRTESTENFIRDNMNDNNKTNKSLWISVGLCIFTAIVNFIINLF